MSFAKYAQFYKDNGFFAGSKIKATVTDNSFIGQEMVLSKGTDVIQTRTIPVSGLVEFFTDESGELTLSSDNGTSTISGSVEVTSYATYNVTLNGASSDNERKAYANDVTMNSETAVANISYTGDVSRISAVASDPSLVSLSISGNKITLRDAGNDKSGKCSITATVASTSEYDSAEVSFNVNKLTGAYGSWEDAPDDTIASMIAKADAGEIDLADFWNIGDTRRVHLNAIEAGTAVSAQPEQDIDLVILHNPINSDYYRLENPTSGYRYQPNFIVGTKNCLANKTGMGYVSQSISVTISYKSATFTNNSYSCMKSGASSELITYLNDGFIDALPSYIKGALKATNRRCIIAGGSQAVSLDGNTQMSYTSRGIYQMKVSLPNLKELGYSSSVSHTSGRTGAVTGVGVYNAQNNSSYDNDTLSKAATYANSEVNGCGIKLAYYEDSSNRIKTRGDTTINSDYLLMDTFIAALGYYDNNSFSTAFYIDSSGVLTTNNLSSEAQRNAQRGISPIMFI